MGAINAPTGPEKSIPEQARGNPVYEQTRQDMPLWCCGRNCGRNSRITVFILGVIGIFASTIVCLSPHYFRFNSLRNDTFCDEDKWQPIPFEYATEANVGLFRYEILEVFEYPWPFPPDKQCDRFDALHNRELERLAAFEAENNDISSNEDLDMFDRLLQIRFPNEDYDDDDSTGEDLTDDGASTEHTTVHQNDTMQILLTRAPADSPTDIEDIPIDEVPDAIPGSNAKDEDRVPTASPSAAPTFGNFNDLIEVEIGVVQPYPAGHELDKLFTQGQQGALWAPIMATLGLIFCAIEFFCCIYKCSWLPTAVFLYVAFMLQLMTLFLFMSEDFCDYTQDCVLGPAGYMSVIAVICYLICQSLVCMTPRPPPKWNLLKKPPVRRKKRKKKKRGEFDEDEKDGTLSGTPDRFHDESSISTNNRYMDAYDSQDPYDSYYGDSNSYSDSHDPYSSHYSDSNGYSDDQDPYSSQYDDSNGYSDGYDNDPNNTYGEDYNDGYDQDDYNNGYDDYDGGNDYDNNGESYADSSENYEEAPSSSSSRRRKK